MTWIPAFEIGIWNAWIFMIVYPLQWLAVLVVPKHISERTGHSPEILKSRRDRIMSFLIQAFWILATLYSIFLPFNIGTYWFYTGLIVFVAGVVVLVNATLSVSRTAKDKPFTEGVYRISRHPMYLSMILVYLGVSISTTSWLFLLLTIVTFFLQRYQMIMEETYCCNKYGRLYIDYMRRTPRWIGIPKR